MFTSHRKRLHDPAGASRRARRGLATAELAVCLPVIVLLVLATIEACTMVFLKQSLTVASYEGVRKALAEGATASQVEAVCNQVLSDRRIDGGTVTIRPRNIPSLEPGEMVDVTVSAPCASNSVIPIMFYEGRTLSSTASMMIEF
jgi:Flp pilus assembly protein TadG